MLNTKMVETKTPNIEQSERHFHKPMHFDTEERDLSALKERIGTARDFVIFTGSKYPYLVRVDNRSLFIEAIQREGCILPERSIDRAIRLSYPFFENIGIDTGRDKAMTMAADHKMVFGGMKA